MTKRQKDKADRSWYKPWLDPGSKAMVGVVLIILLILLSVFLPKSQFQQAKEQLVKNPNDFEAHLILAEEYLNNNQIDEAEKELLLAQQIKQSSYQATELWQRKQESDPRDVKKLIKRWEQVISKRPDYRDGYLQLTILRYKLYENEKAREYLDKALKLDPNFEPAREMERILGH